MVWEEEDWVDEEETSHRGLDDWDMLHAFKFQV